MKVSEYIISIAKLMSVACDEPNEITIAAMKEAMNGKGKKVGLAKWNEFMAFLQLI